MKYSLLFYEVSREMTGDEQAAYQGAWGAYIGALGQSGAMLAGEALQPIATATTVRTKNGAPLVQDGPFADTKEQLAGFVIVELPTLDAALEWAARCPCAEEGSVEVRPVLDTSGMM